MSNATLGAQSGKSMAMSVTMSKPCAQLKKPPKHKSRKAARLALPVARAKSSSHSR